MKINVSHGTVSIHLLRISSVSEKLVLLAIHSCFCGLQQVKKKNH